MARRAGATPAEIAALLTRLKNADTPYRSWASVALLHAPNAPYHLTGRAWAAELLKVMPAAGEDLEHSDLACYAMLSADLLSAAARARVAQAIPQPNPVVRRARLFESPLFVYLVARGLGAEMPNRAEFVTFVVSGALVAAERTGAHIPGLMLQVATVFEIAPVSEVPDSLLRAVHARLVASDGGAHAAVAVHWLLERYKNRWPSSAEAGELRRAAEHFVELHPPVAIDVSALGLDLTVMRLETATLSDRRYRFVSDENMRQEVNERVTQRRWLIACMSIVSIGALCAIPAYFLVTHWALPTATGIAATILLWSPLACWSTISTFGRRRRDGPLIGGTAMGAIYYVAVGIAAVTRNPDFLKITKGSGLLLTCVGVVVPTVFGVIGAEVIDKPTS